MGEEEPLDLAIIQNQLRLAVNEQTRLNGLYREASIKAADTEADFKIDFSRERFAAVSADSKKITAPTAHDIATDATADAYRAYKLAEAEQDIIKQALFSNREKQQTLRTLASSYRMLELGGN